ncbi:glycoside hydrolase family 15 protein [Almyronema epifaneia]|uniref:Glycoside hydrolase family 15 protein n=1 Tax=Almyronema epifaneia S1 TaxID=2991925 RepID=A0ABW6IFQ6_9CYAN
MIFHNERLLDFVQFEYQAETLRSLQTFLQGQGVFQLPILANGLFPAAAVSATTAYTGYASVWVRDNVYLAYSHYIRGQTAIAVKTAQGLMRYFQKHRWRFEKIINHQADPNDVMQRPHVRFNGQTLTEIDQPWQHAQNDALGYFLWFYSLLVNANAIALQPSDLEVLALFALYFEAIAYWQDLDSGHWEEARKISATSIGTVVAALNAFRSIWQRWQTNVGGVNPALSVATLDSLIAKGETALAAILPAECIQPAPQGRRYDAALLFLIYPLQIVSDAMADEILAAVITHLQGNYGVRRYLNDSFWCRNYQDLPENIRTTLSRDREQWLSQQGRRLTLGEEAQWCLFDPILSAIFGLKFQRDRQPQWRQQQTHYFNRALGQLTGDDCPQGALKCPELYYLQNGQYIANDATPLLWTQANLQIAFALLQQSLEASPPKIPFSPPPTE